MVLSCGRTCRLRLSVFCLNKFVLWTPSSFLPTSITTLESRHKSCGLPAQPCFTPRLSAGAQGHSCCRPVSIHSSLLDSYPYTLKESHPRLPAADAPIFCPLQPPESTMKCDPNPSSTDQDHRAEETGTKTTHQTASIRPTTSSQVLCNFTSYAPGFVAFGSTSDEASFG